MIRTRPGRTLLAPTAAWLATVMAILIATQSAAKDVYEGRAEIVDGDTVQIAGAPERFRLYGIDAPERGQSCEDAGGKRYLCGSRSAQYLAALVGRPGRIRCVEEDRDRYSRIVAECTLPSGLVLNREMVRAGWAIEYRKYSDGRYRAAEAEAKASKFGLWSGRFVDPSLFRSGKREEKAAEARQVPPAAKGDGSHDDCAIKGNISRSGRIYHSPGQADYERTRIDQSKGERWFCSAAEAEAAGWKPAKS